MQYKSNFTGTINLYSSLYAHAAPNQRPVAQFAFLLITVILIIAALDALCLSAVNPWIMSTAPLSRISQTNQVIGYSWLLDGRAFFKENLSPLFNSLVFNGYFYWPDGYYLRPLYPYLISLCSWLLGLRPAAQLINFIAYAVVVVITGLLARDLSGRRRIGLWAGAMAAVSTGLFVHLNDFSAHILDHAVYIVVVFAVFRSNVWCKPRPTQVHLRLGLLLAIASLTYPNGIALTVAYILTAFFYSRLRDIALGATLGILSGPLWHMVLAAAYAKYFSIDIGNLYLENFSTDLRASLVEWLQELHLGLLPFTAALAHPLIDCLFVGFPPLVIFGLIAVIAAHWRHLPRLWFFLVFFFITFVGPVLFSYGAAGRGYLAAPSVPLLAVALAMVLLGGEHVRWRKPGVAMFAVLLIGQALWSTAYLVGYFFPIQTFIVGWFSSGNPLIATRFYNLTGNQPLWRFLGGSADFSAAGGLPLGAIVPANSNPHSLRFALILNAFMLLPFMALIVSYNWVALRTSLARLMGKLGLPMRSLGVFEIATWCTVYGGVALALMGIADARPHQSVQPFSTDVVSQYRGAVQFSYSVDISEQVVSELATFLKQFPDAELQVFLRGKGLHNSRILLGDRDLSAKQLGQHEDADTYLWRVDTAPFRALNGSQALSLTGQLVDGVLGGWQSGPIPGRRIVPEPRANGVYYTPSLELRLVDTERNSVLLVAY